jgi:Holliday junction resolvase
MSRWERAELRVADELGGKLVRGSGRGARKGDVITDEYLVEVKETGRPFFDVTENMLLKIHQEAMLHERTPVLAIEFHDRTLHYFLLSNSSSAPNKQVRLHNDTGYEDIKVGRFKIKRVDPESLN